MSQLNFFANFNSRLEVAEQITLTEAIEAIAHRPQCPPEPNRSPHNEAIPPALPPAKELSPGWVDPSDPSQIHRRKRKETEPQAATHTIENNIFETLDLFTDGIEGGAA